MKKFRIENDKITTVVTLKSLAGAKDYPYEDGWRNPVIPEGFNPEVNQLGEEYFDKELDKVTWTVVPLNLPDLDELKTQKLEEFDPILNEFSLLVFRTKIVSGENSELDQMINIIKQQKDKTAADINAFTNASELMKFSFKAEYIQAMKNRLKPFLL